VNEQELQNAKSLRHMRHVHITTDTGKHATCILTSARGIVALVVSTTACALDMRNTAGYSARPLAPRGGSDALGRRVSTLVTSRTFHNSGASEGRPSEEVCWVDNAQNAGTAGRT
jgi:hypothetical protein